MHELLDREAVKTWRVIHNAHRAIFTALDSMMHQDGCSLSRLQVMFVLYFEGPMKPVQLADRHMVTRGNMSQLIARMVKEALIEPVESPQKARPEYQLSPKGKSLFETIFPGHIERICNLMPPLDPEVRAVLATVPRLAKDRC